MRCAATRIPSAGTAARPPRTASGSVEVRRASSSAALSSPCSLRGACLMRRPVPSSVRMPKMDSIQEANGCWQVCPRNCQAEGRRVLITWRSASITPCIFKVDFRCGSLQRLSDDLRFVEWKAISVFCNLGHFAFFLFEGAATGHRGRGADADGVLRAESHATAPDQQSHIRTLSPTVGVQFVEDEKTHPWGGANQFAVLPCG